MTVLQIRPFYQIYIDEKSYFCEKFSQEQRSQIFGIVDEFYDFAHLFAG